MTTALIKHIDEIINSKSLLKHPFYQSWSKGELPKESLKKYAKEYFHFEAMYPTFLSAVHSRCSDRKVRQLILDNLTPVTETTYSSLIQAYFSVPS